MELTSEQKDFLDKYTRGTWELNPEGLVDVQGDFNCFNQGLTDFKSVRFGQVSGDFSYSINKLTTLEGAPREVGGDFSCSGNNLTTLKGAPREVGGSFYCSGNPLTNLKGAPQTVGGDFYCHDNKLTTLKGAPQVIEGRFNSDYVEVPAGQWSLRTLVEMYKNSSGQKKELLGTLVSPEALQKEIDVNPERAAVELKSIVNLPEFGGLRWPKSLKPEIDLLSDLDSVGL